GALPEHRGAGLTMQRNAVVLLSDQPTVRALGCSRNQQVQTPNLDRLAAQGVQINAANATCPVCAGALCLLHRHAHTVETVRYPVATGRDSVDSGHSSSRRESKRVYTNQF